MSMVLLITSLYRMDNSKSVDRLRMLGLCITTWFNILPSQYNRVILILNIFTNKIYTCMVIKWSKHQNLFQNIFWFCRDNRYFWWTECKAKKCYSYECTVSENIWEKKMQNKLGLAFFSSNFYFKHQFPKIWCFTLLSAM